MSTAELPKGVAPWDRMLTLRGEKANVTAWPGRQMNIEPTLTTQPDSDATLETFYGGKLVYAGYRIISGGRCVFLLHFSDAPQRIFDVCAGEEITSVD